MTPATLLEAVTAVARVGGAVALAHFRRDVSVETKSDGSPVTIADRSAERAVRDWIVDRFPGDGLLGEELGETPSNTGRRWLIDPIDGTRTFVHGVPLWGTLVAVAEGERVIAGAAYYPAVDESIGAAVGEGCWHDGRRCAVSTVAVLGEATLLTTDARFGSDASRKARFDALAARVATSRTWGDCYGYLLVATGRAEVMIDSRAREWDLAAFDPIITEAGGVLTDWKGRRTAFGGGAIATNGALDRDVRRALLDTSDDAGTADA